MGSHFASRRDTCLSNAATTEEGDGCDTLAGGSPTNAGRKKKKTTKRGRGKREVKRGEKRRKTRELSRTESGQEVLSLDQHLRQPGMRISRKQTRANWAPVRHHERTRHLLREARVEKISIMFFGWGKRGRPAKSSNLVNGLKKKKSFERPLRVPAGWEAPPRSQRSATPLGKDGGRVQIERDKEKGGKSVGSLLEKRENERRRIQVQKMKKNFSAKV